MLIILEKIGISYNIWTGYIYVTRIPGREWAHLISSIQDTTILERINASVCVGFQK